MKRKFNEIVTLLAAASLTSCGQPASAPQEKEGVYGASSGPNPNLADLQEKAPEGEAEQSASEQPEPANPEDDPAP